MLCTSNFRHPALQCFKAARWRTLPVPTGASWRTLGASRHYAAQATQESSHESAPSLSVPSDPRYNQIGIQQLSSYMQKQVFPLGSSPAPVSLVELSEDHLKRHGLLGKIQENGAPIAFSLPSLCGHSLDEHFYKLGRDSSEPFSTLASHHARVELPRMPRVWIRQSGWTKYHIDGTHEAVDFPHEDGLTFDTEVMWKESPFAVMACAAGENAWYAWLSPWLLGESDNARHLIPLGDPTKARVIVGHNVGYDRARVLEEYDIKQSQNFFLDTMSLHVAVNGMCSRQRPTWMKHQKSRDFRENAAKENPSLELSSIIEQGLLNDEEEDLWVGRSSINSLRDVAKFHCNITIDKARRDEFGQLSREELNGKVDELLDYCAADVSITHRVYQKVFPTFLETCPHPVSFGALRHLASVILPIDKSWNAYIQRSEETFRSLSASVERRLVELAEQVLQIKDNPDQYLADPWLRQLDWSGQTIRMVKSKKGEKPRPAARQKKPGMPQWYKDLFATNESDIALTVRTRIAPLLLRLSWDGFPLVWSDKFGWTVRAPLGDSHAFESKSMVACDMSEEKNVALSRDRAHRYFKLPHKNGPQARCANPLAKGYLQYFESNILASEYTYAKEALNMNASCSYWISARDRIRSQMAVFHSDLTDNQLQSTTMQVAGNEQGFILPQLIPMGTITRRAVENTWLTASNAKLNRVGSELKSMIKAPPGYRFVGADVDSQELWIASLVGDAHFKIHGGNAIGFMTLEGDKAAGTDVHSKTAEILGISRNDAKVFNYGRLYGAGLKFASTLLRQFNPMLSEKEAHETASHLYRETKGTRTLRRSLRDRSFWRGGTESFVFNGLEDFAEQERPRTPVLGAGITEALMRRYINKGGFMTSRINWAIQSSGVDYLHLLIVSMDYLIRRFNIDARLAISVHDEIRYLVKEEDKYRGAMALQVSNLWTRAMFSHRMGIDEVPQSCAYFSAVDVDHVLRKEVDMDCVTPSHPEKISPGETLTIASLLAKGDIAHLDSSIMPNATVRPNKFQYEPQRNIMNEIVDKSDASYIKAQICSNVEELDRIVKSKMTANRPKKAATSSPGHPRRTSSNTYQPRNRSSYPQPQGTNLMGRSSNNKGHAGPAGPGKPRQPGLRMPHVYPPKAIEDRVF